VPAHQTRQRIAVILEHGWVETQSFVREPIAHLAAAGFEIDLFARAAENWTPIDGVRYFPRQSFRKPAAQVLAARLLARALLRRDYDLVIATPAISLVFGAVLARLAGVPLVALHDELWTPRDINLATRLRHAMYRAHERAALTIITDLRRVDVLQADWPALRGHRFVELPNAPAGEPTACDREGMRAKLGVPADTTVLLNAGSLTKRFGLDYLLGAIPHFPENALLVCQSAMHTHRLDPAVVALLEARYPVRFRLDPLPYGRVDELVAAADIGVALYHGSIPNVRYVGKGSGKLNRYLRAAKPVIVDRNANLEFVGDYDAGVVISHPCEVPSAISAITENYETFSANARRCFDEQLAFETHWPQVHAALGELMSAS
jgi:glycosyltransferase involved in cell wall biosynthesis